MDQSATGFYGLNDDDAPVADRSSVMVAFDGPLDASSISTNTFSVALDKDNDAQITDVDVDGNYVFLKLQDQLASNATPMVSIAEGEGVEDRAGNQTLSNEFGEITVNDGITPQLVGIPQRRFRHWHRRRRSREADQEPDHHPGRV